MHDVMSLDTIVRSDLKITWLRSVASGRRVCSLATDLAASHDVTVRDAIGLRRKGCACNAIRHLRSLVQSTSHMHWNQLRSVGG